MTPMTSTVIDVFPSESSIKRHVMGDGGEMPNDESDKTNWRRKSVTKAV